MAEVFCSVTASSICVYILCTRAHLPRDVGLPAAPRLRQVLQDGAGLGRGDKETSVEAKTTRHNDGTITCHVIQATRYDSSPRLCLLHSSGDSSRWTTYAPRPPPSHLVLLDALRHHVQDVVHDGGAQLQVEVRLHALLGHRLGDALGLAPLELASQQVAQPALQERDDACKGLDITFQLAT